MKFCTVFIYISIAVNSWSNSSMNSLFCSRNSFAPKLQERTLSHFSGIFCHPSCMSQNPYLLKLSSWFFFSCFNSTEMSSWYEIRDFESIFPSETKFFFNSRRSILNCKNLLPMQSACILTTVRPFFMKYFALLSSLPCLLVGIRTFKIDVAQTIKASLIIICAPMEECLDPRSFQCLEN